MLFNFEPFSMQWSQDQSDSGLVTSAIPLFQSRHFLVMLCEKMYLPNVLILQQAEAYYLISELITSWMEGGRKDMVDSGEDGRNWMASWGIHYFIACRTFFISISILISVRAHSALRDRPLRMNSDGPYLIGSKPMFEFWKLLGTLLWSVYYITVIESVSFTLDFLPCWSVTFHTWMTLWHYVIEKFIQVQLFSRNIKLQGFSNHKVSNGGKVLEVQNSFVPGKYFEQFYTMGTKILILCQVMYFEFRQPFNGVKQWSMVFVYCKL